MANGIGLEDPELSALINDQLGVVSATQAVSRGLSRETMRRRVLRGLWQRMTPGVYALQSGPPSRMQWLIAAQLYAGEDSVLTGRSALRVYGVEIRGIEPRGIETRGAETRGLEVIGRRVGAPELHALVPHRTRRRNLERLRITRTTRVPQSTQIGVLRVAPLARSVLDCCLAAVEDGDVAAVDEIVTAAFADGRVQLAELEYELGQAPRRHSGRLRSELATSKAHVRAVATRALLERLRVSGPRGAQCEVSVFLNRALLAQVAAVWPRRAVVVVVDAAEREIRSLSFLGFAVVHVTAWQVEQDLVGVLRDVGRVLADRPEATLPAGVSLFPRARTSLAGAASEPMARAQRVLTESSPARTGISSVLPLGGTGQT